MFSGCPSVCACVYRPTYRAKAFSDRLAVDSIALFCFLLFYFILDAWTPLMAKGANETV